MGKLQEFVRECIIGCKSRAEINTQNKAEVLLDKFAKHLDDNGGPGGVSSWNDLTDKPFGDVEFTEVCILPETAYAIGESGDSPILNPPDPALIVGNSYTVNWNGTPYSCTAQNFDIDGMLTSVVGDLGAATGGESTGEPFLIVFLPFDAVELAGAYGMIMAMDGSVSGTVSVSEFVEVIHKLDNKFLDLHWLPAETGNAEAVFIPTQTTKKSGDLVIASTKLDQTMLSEGAKIAIYIDGERYEATLSAMGQGFFAGNMVILEPDVPDTGEPYVFLSYEEMVQLSVVPEAEHVVAVHVYRPGPNKLPSDFLPEIAATKQYLHAQLNSKSLTRLVDGGTSAVRMYSTSAEDEEYKMGDYSLALGYFTKARGRSSLAMGSHTIASGQLQFVGGAYNIEDAEHKYAHIVGNGVHDSPSNAYTLDWNGNGWFEGTVEGTALILKSSTRDSTKRFKITVNDSGTLSAAEVTE